LKEKTQVNFRLNETIIKEMDSIAKRHQVTRTDVINVLIHAYHVGVNEEDQISEWFELARVS